MNASINKWIIAAGVLLVILIIVTFIISSVTQNNQSSPQPSPIPTGVLDSEGDFRILSTQERQSLEQEVADIDSHFFTEDQADRYDEFKTKLPVIDDDFELGFSEATGQFFIRKKTTNADEELEGFLRSNNFLDVYQQFPDLFVTTDQPIEQAIQQAEENFINNHQELIDEQRRRISRRFSISPDVNSRNAGSLVDFMQGVVDVEDIKLRDDETGSTSGTDGGSSEDQTENDSCLGAEFKCRPNNCLTGEDRVTNRNCAGPNRVCCKPSSGSRSGSSGDSDSQPDNTAFTDRQISPALMEIFMEAGNRINIDPKLLAAVMAQECATLLYAPQSFVTKNSRLPSNHTCYKTGTDVYGPMQFKQQFWSYYATRVQTILGHRGNIQNIRDAVYAAAIKLKAGSQARDPFNLTRQEVFKASSIYNTGHLTASGGCANPGYCQNVWTYYDNH